MIDLRCAAALSTVLALLCVSLTAQAGNQRAAGDVLDLDGRPVDPFAGSDRLVVFIFVRTDCPISNRYAPEIQRLASAFGRRGVTFRLVYPESGASAASIAAHLREYGYAIPVLRDPRHHLAKLAGATVTPEAAVFDGERLVYHGRIDDRFAAFGLSRPAPAVRDLEHVLSDILGGRAVVPFTRPAVGCVIEGTT